MRKLLFASHAYLAKGILSSLELIMGHQEQVDILCAYTEEPYDLRAEIQRRLDALGEQDELIVITDVFGGSVNNELCPLSRTADKGASGSRFESVVAYESLFQNGRRRRYGRDDQSMSGRSQMFAAVL